MTPVSILSRATVAFAALLLACCASPLTNGPEASFDQNLRFPVSVEPQMMTMRLPYNSGPEGLDQSAVAQLARFAADYLDHGSGAIAVSAAASYGNAPNDVAGRLVDLGVPEDRILIGHQDDPGSAPGVKLTYIRYVAQTPACGNWSANLASTNANAPQPNFGCATQHNIAAMIADPRDLVSPRPLTPADAARRLEVLEKYRKGESTVAQKTQAQSGVVSTVGNM